MVTMKEKTLEELQDEFNSLTRKRNQTILDLEEATKKLVELAEKIYEKSPDYVKIVCPSCEGTGIINTEEGKKVKCPSCQMRGFVWARKHKGVDKLNDD